MRTRPLMTTVLAAVMIATLAAPAGASARGGDRDVGSARLADPAPIVLPAAPDTDLKEMTAPLKLTTHSKSRVEVRYEPSDTTHISVGFGWRIYVYLDRGDWIWLAGLGYTAATSALCAALVSSGVGAVACGIAAYIIGSWVIPRSAPPTGYCRELSFYYWGGYSGSKLVRRSW